MIINRSCDFPVGDGVSRKLKSMSPAPSIVVHTPSLLLENYSRDASPKLIEHLKCAGLSHTLYSFIFSGMLHFSCYYPFSASGNWGPPKQSDFSEVTECQSYDLIPGLLTRQFDSDFISRLEDLHNAVSDPILLNFDSRRNGSKPQLGWGKEASFRARAGWVPVTVSGSSPWFTIVKF